MKLRWRSKMYELAPGSAGFSCAKVIARNYPVKLKVFADSGIMVEIDVLDRNMFRLPAGYVLCRDWEVEVEAVHEVQSIQIASSPSEII